MFFYEKFHLFQKYRILDRVFRLERVILGFNAQIQLWEDSGRLMEGRPVTTLGQHGGGKRFLRVPNFSNCVEYFQTTVCPTHFCKGGKQAFLGGAKTSVPSKVSTAQLRSTTSQSA